MVQLERIEAQLEAEKQSVSARQEVFVVRSEKERAAILNKHKDQNINLILIKCYQEKHEQNHNPK